MFVYLDESGDTGFRFRHGSTRYFVIALLLVDDPIPIQATIDELRRELRYDARTEFKFSHTREENRKKFLARLIRHDFAIRAMVVDKTYLAEPRMKHRDSFYGELVRVILQHAGEAIRDAVLVLDESVKSRKRQDRVGTVLRRALNDGPAHPRLRDVVRHKSRADNLIQAADMVSGAIYCAYHRNDDRYLRIIRRKLEGPSGDLLVWAPEAPETQ